LFRFAIDRASDDEREASDLRGRAWAGWRPGDRQALIWGHAGDLQGYAGLRARLQNALYLRMLFLDSFDMNERVILEFRERLVRHRPTVVAGYARALALVAQLLGERGLAVPAPRGVISAAESLSDEDRSLIEGAFGCRVYDRYGSREFGVVAQQCAETGGLHLSAERLIVEVLDPQGRPCPPGVLGEITVTDLGNLVMPFIRYRTGDLAVLASGPCPCGRTLPTLARVLGRTSDVLVGRNDRLVACPGPTFFTAGTGGVQQLQILQAADGAITLVVVRSGEWREESAEALRARMRSLLGDIAVSVRFAEEIPSAPSGKYRFCISEATPFRR
jgi:phenylacetate-CoA ligase